MRFDKFPIMIKKKMSHWGVPFYVGFFLAALIAGGCAHYPANPFLKEVSPDRGYRLKNVGHPEKSDSLLLFLTFSGGGTRAAALAYGVLKELAETEIFLEGRKRSLLDEVDAISGVSGGSFTAAYYGLFGNRIFEDFESRFLKKNIQRELFNQTLELPNWVHLLSGKFGRSDLAAEYYDKHIFEGGTFGDIAARGGPFIIVNATDVALGTYFPFTQDMFDIFCSDVSRFPLARAVAASSAVPVILSPITLYNYAGSCNYEAPEWMKRALEEPGLSRRRYQQALHLSSYMDAQKRPYIHLIDGGIADNLGLRPAIDRVTAMGDIWQSLQYLGRENTRKVVFILVNAEKQQDFRSDYLERTLGSGRVLSSVTNIPIIRYNFETVELLKENFKQWADEIRSQRCGASKKLDKVAPSPSDSVSCADIKFYLVEVDFEALPDKSERSYLNRLPTSFNLPPEAVDRLRGAARRLLKQSPEFQRLLSDLR
jgi:NTE family protein